MAPYSDGSPFLPACCCSACCTLDRKVAPPSAFVITVQRSGFAHARCSRAAASNTAG